MMIWLKSFFSESDGKGSFGRLASFVALIVVLNMAAGAVKSGGDLPGNLGALGLFFLAVTSPYLGNKAADVIKSFKKG